MTSFYAIDRRAFLKMAGGLSAALLFEPGEWLDAELPEQTDTRVLVSRKEWKDAIITFKARTPANAGPVQLWGAFRCRDRHSRYVFALRGGDNNDVYLARQAPDGGAKFLGFAPLDFKPAPGVWYSVRLAILGNRFQIHLNDESLPRLNVVDSDALWDQGAVFLGGGWLPAEYAKLRIKSLTPEEKAAFRAVGDKCRTPPAVNKEARRQTQRARYTPARIDAFNPQRTEVSLDGDWLFMPDYQLRGGAMPVSLEFEDRAWHVMNVPEFWTPGLSWLYGETGFPYLEGVARTKGVAEGLSVEEARRVEAYSFDWKKTTAAWYRHYVDLPGDLGGRRFELIFDAIAKISEIWFNGVKVGAHTGLFAEIRCEVTRAVRPGRNVIAVHVIGTINAPLKAKDNVEAVAVTVAVTPQMLNSLPHGMLQEDACGIWQPVRLAVTAPVLVRDCFIETRLDGADIHLEVLNTGGQDAGLAVDYVIKAAADGRTLCRSNDSPPIRLEVQAGAQRQIKFSTPRLSPKLWTPQEPNLHVLELQIRSGRRVLDHCALRFGFRTFETDGGKLLLNGQPYWLRGANPFPCNLRPNDKALARRFTLLAHEGNVRVVRTHIVPYTAAWLEAADEIGMGVSYEGIWPWLMMRGEPPTEPLLDVWRREYLALVRKYRNHPSILLWTVNNEMNFGSFDQNDPVLLKKKWSILDDMIRRIRQADPTRPVVAYSGYVRKAAQEGYEAVVKPNGFDDGDLDDAHRYYGWYDKSFFHLFDGEFGAVATRGRPLISQEMSTGYPNNDDGHPTRFYLFQHETPQALVGNDAYENADPALFLDRQAFMTKELAETLRRANRDTAAGILHFAYCTWFKRPWRVDEISPWPAYHALKAALQPVLVSAELFGRHFYAGSALQRRVCIVNDSEDGSALPTGRLVWEVKHKEKALAGGRAAVSPVNYYQNRWLEVSFVMPRNLPAPRVDAELVLRLEAGNKILSENRYDIALATMAWAGSRLNKKSKISLWDPAGRARGILSGVPITIVDSIENGDSAKVLIVGDLAGVSLTTSQASGLRKFVLQGGRALLLHPGAWLTEVFPDQVKTFIAKEGEIVSMWAPDSPVFEGIEPLDLAWFERGDRQLPLACTGVYQIASLRQDTAPLAWQCGLHGYLSQPSEVVKFSGTPLLELTPGQGRLVASELCFECGTSDPVARRLLMNTIRYLQQ
ncbi:MAG: glycoside hydrolase family 2 [Verrucomicrobiota bacterium]|nr:glycoside hydrolase family 2 [Verrucomicrobiota bacterium]